MDSYLTCFLNCVTGVTGSILASVYIILDVSRQVIVYCWFEEIVISLAESFEFSDAEDIYCLKLDNVNSLNHCVGDTFLLLLRNVYDGLNYS
jgi:hypothetical protein